MRKRGQTGDSNQKMQYVDRNTIFFYTDRRIIFCKKQKPIGTREHRSHLNSDMWREQKKLFPAQNLKSTNLAHMLHGVFCSL